MNKNENNSEKVSAPETRKHTMDCLSKGDASACPICKPINDAAYQRDRDELHKEQDQLLESEVSANQNRACIFTQEQEDEVRALKRALPYRIVYGAVKAETGEFRMGADYDRRKLNGLLRKGWLVATIEEVA